MGMFDYCKIDKNIHCENCNVNLSGWQTKDGECVLAAVNFKSDEIKSALTICEFCGASSRIEKIAGTDEVRVTTKYFTKQKWR